MPKAGSSIRQMARECRNGAFLRFGAAGTLVIAPFLFAVRFLLRLNYSMRVVQLNNYSF